MIESSPAVPIDSDVLIAPHHGADNASSTAFIAAVSPEWVVFPAGRRYSIRMLVQRCVISLRESIRAGFFGRILGMMRG